jgi:type I restriction enzyme, S subunit
VDSEFGYFPVYGSTGIIGRSIKGDYSGRAILIARVGANAGKLTVVEGEYGVTDNTIILQINNSVLWSYVWRQLEAKRLNSMVFGSGQPLITGTQIKHILIPFPPTKAEQEATIGALDDADALIETLEHLLAKKRHLKQGAMQELLTGQTRLPGFGHGEQRYRSTKFGMMPADWVPTSLDRVAAFITKG